MYKCPQNHESETADFCSVCGAEVAARDRSDSADKAAASPGPPAAEQSSNSAGRPCPDCGTPCESAGQVFCEVCGHNFQTGTSGVPPIPAAPGPVPVSALAPGAAPVVGGTTQPAPAADARPAAAVRWRVTVQADPSLYGTVDPDAPAAQPAQVFEVFAAENLIGRLTPGVRAHVPVHNDPGVSRRHALLVCQPEGGLSVRDLGSANGTQVNGVDLVPGVATPLNDGDSIALGAWTRITVNAAQAARVSP